MKLPILARCAISFLMLALPTGYHHVKPEPKNCYRIKHGKRHYVECNHACSADPKGHFNAEGRCSRCGHLVKKRPDFFIEKGKKS